uniref:NACHT domain-containing protein n=1 Tax=Salarias fasciatus TaxID=181472 RepID=A0A672GYX0_SALFA
MNTMSSTPEILLKMLDDLTSEDFKRFKFHLTEIGIFEGCNAIPVGQRETLDKVDTATQIHDRYSDHALDLMKLLLEKMGKKWIWDKHTINTTEPEGKTWKHENLILKNKFQYVFELIPKQGEAPVLNDIYTELKITKGGTAGVNKEHEVIQNPTASRKKDREEGSMKPEKLFEASPGRSEKVRTVLTKGDAGFGKTVLTQKFTLDWAEDKANQDIHFIFAFTFRELNLEKEKKFSLVGLVHHFFTETKEAGICSFDDFQVVFIFDGLDECRPPLNFHQTGTLTDVTEPTSVDVLLINLIKGNLLPSARIWITTRPAAANQIPDKCVNRVTEVQGFTDEQKEEYFRKRFREEEQASRIISHIKKSQSLHIMCHIPLFCWITAEVLEEELENREGRELPKTLTQMYIQHLKVQAKMNSVKCDDGSTSDEIWSPTSREMIESLGKLAFDQLQKGNLTFVPYDLTDCGIDLKAASVYSGMFTKILKKEKGLHNSVFCFIHLSFQEFLAALHVHQIFIKSGINLLDGKQQTSKMSKEMKTTPTLHHLHQRAVDEALKSPNGHLDLFLRFLLGLSLETNQSLLRGLLTQTGSSSQTNQKTVQYIKKKLNESLSAERSINLFHCLNELNDGSLVEQIQQSLRSGSLSIDILSPAQWSALAFILMSSEEDRKEFDLKKYSASEEALLSCGALSSVLHSQSSRLTDLDLSFNHPGESGVKMLPSGFHCWFLFRLENCGLSERSCGALSSVLSSQSSSLTHLDLSNNDLKDSGVKLISAGLESPHCKLEALRSGSSCCFIIHICVSSLSGCLVSEEGCASLVSAVRSKSSHLTELDLSYNHPGDSRVKLLSAAVEDPYCKLKTLRYDLTGAGGKWMTVGQRRRGGRCVRRKREKRNTESLRLRVGTLNVGTMTGKGRELVDKMQKRKVDILCVQETRWKGSKAGRLGAGFKLLYHGVDRKRNGVGFILKEEFVRNVLEAKKCQI